MQNRLNIDRDGLYLYRNVIPTGLPNLAFVGGEVSTFNNILTHGLQAANTNPDPNPNPNPDPDLTLALHLGCR